VALVLLALTACSPTSRPPTGLEEGNGGGTSSGGGGGTTAIVGTWQNVFLVTVVNDVQRITTTFRFDTGGSCLKTVESFSAVEGFPRIHRHDCRYQLDGTDILIALDGGTPERFSISFDDFNRNRLLLDGVLFTRVA
jgi:hypothetical protein